MTNEDIIKGLTRMRKNFDSNSVYGSYCIDFLDAAIEALKEQPEHRQNTVQKQPDLDTLGIKTGETCADAISRQDAIDMLEKAMCEDGFRSETGLIHKTTAYEIIRHLPSAQPNLQPTCNNLATDAISRQAAIDALNVLCQEHRYRIPGKRETYSQYNEAWQDALDRAEGAIFNLPSAQSKQLKVLANVLDGCPLTQPCDKMWRGGWCEEHCKNNKLQEPNAECWQRYAEVMANDQ